MLSDKDKQEIAEIMAGVLNRHESACVLGIKKETAYELIAFAQTYKAYRKGMTVAVVGLIVAGIGAALWAGFKALVRGN